MAELSRTRKSEKKSKRRREESEANTSGKSAKKSRREEKKPSKKASVESTKAKEDENSQDAVARKLAKLTVDERKSYEERAALKSQTLHEYVLRRIQKKSEKDAPKR